MGRKYARYPCHLFRSLDLGKPTRTKSLKPLPAHLERPGFCPLDPWIGSRSAGYSETLVEDLKRRPKSYTPENLLPDQYRSTVLCNYGQADPPFGAKHLRHRQDRRVWPTVVKNAERCPRCYSVFQSLLSVSESIRVFLGHETPVEHPPPGDAN